MHYKRKELATDRVFSLVVNSFLFISLVIVLYLLLYIVACSFSEPQAVMAKKVWLFPVNFDLVSYKAVFTNKQIGTGYMNSLYYMVTGTVVSVLLTMLLAYPLSRKEFYGRSVVTKLILFTMLFTGGTIPLYLVVRNLGIYDSRWAIILPNAITVWNVIIARTFLQENISDELYEAAEIDGANKWKKIWHITLPSLVPMITVMLLLSVGSIMKSDTGLFYQVTRNSGVLYSTTQVIDSYVLNAIFKNSNFGFVAATSFFQSIVGLLLMLVANGAVRKAAPDNALF